MKKKISIGHFIAILLVSAICTELYAQHTTDFTFTETAPEYIRTTMGKNTKAIFNELNKAYDQKKIELNLSTTNATPEAIERIKSLWKTSPFYCTETEITTRVLKQSNSRGWQVRNIPVFFKEGKTNEDRYKNIAIEFTPNGKINDLYIVLWEHDYPNLTEKMNEVADFRYRQMIIEFVENFRTAYNRKDLPFLEEIYSDNALIITGKVITQKNNKGDAPRLIDAQQVEYNVQNKKDYLTKLKRIFANNYINVKFDSIVIKQHEGDPKIYGVTLRQTWRASNYSDEGWLFLMIDYEDEDKPQIWVRTWQPLKDNFGNPIHYNTEDIFGLGHFNY
jgi:hypothetical protein